MSSIVSIYARRGQHVYKHLVRNHIVLLVFLFDPLRVQQGWKDRATNPDMFSRSPMPALTLGGRVCVLKG